MHRASPPEERRQERLRRVPVRRATLGASTAFARTRLAVAAAFGVAAGWVVAPRSGLPGSPGLLLLGLVALKSDETACAGSSRAGGVCARLGEAAAPANPTMKPSRAAILRASSRPSFILPPSPAAAAAPSAEAAGSNAMLAGRVARALRTRGAPFSSHRASVEQT